METPTFIESYDTENYELCDRLIERLDYYIDEWSQGRGGGHLCIGNTNLNDHMMQGSQDNGGLANRKDFAFDFYALDDPLRVDVHNQILAPYIAKYCDTYPSYGMNVSGSWNCKVQKTPPKGGFHSWHKEQGPFQYQARTLVWTLYLNDMPDGEGETEFLEYGIKVPAKKGRLCFFPAAFTHTHRGNAVYSHDKYIATGWYYLVGD